MKGDFSKWCFDRKNNFSGVLHQQGRVMLDSDWNDQTRINQDWQSQAGKDVIGLGVAAVPINGKDSFSVVGASVENNDVKLTVTPGKLWADGFPVTLSGEKNLDCFATYFKQPNQGPFTENSRDLIILEIWQDSISGFQMPELLIEHALGGPDTTERIHTEIAFKLLRLEDNDTCESVTNKLQDDPKKSGKLTVSLKPSSSISIDPKCPKVDSGGYTGLEHNLYRIEIADVNDSTKPMFKWSQFNGGLVGRGTYRLSTDIKSSPNKFEIIDNLQTIVSCERDSFYLEVVNFDNKLGYQKVTYSAIVSLQNNMLLVVKPFLDETSEHKTPDPNENVFFRLWNGLENISDYQSGLKDLPNNCGIQLNFETGGSFSPQDYWTFPVRAGGKVSTSPLIDNQPPEGIQYHRVPLAIVKWNGNRKASVIGDCRSVFTSLTDLYKQKKSDCTLIVSPGEGWERIFEKIVENQDAKVCFQVGEYLLDKPIELENKGHIRISGCGEGTRIKSSGSEIVFKFVSCKSVVVKDLYAEAEKTGSKKEEKLNNQNGVLTFCACPKVTVEGAVLKCAAGAERAANCIDVRDSVTYGKQAGRNPTLVPVQSVRVHNCDLSVGHMQSGILLINVRRANIENNIIQAYDIPKSLPLKVLLENKRYRSAVRSLMIYSPTLGKPVSTTSDPKVATIEGIKGFVRFYTDQLLTSAWTEWHKLSPALGVQSNHDMLLHMIHVADDALLGEGVLKAGGKDFFGFKEWYDKLFEENVAVGSQGILIAGTVAEETHIINNTVSSFMQGIHVGTSHREAISGIYDSSGIVQIMGNNVRIQLSPVVTRERHGIFVGNRNSLIIQNNYVSVQRGSLTKDLRIDGIRVYGHPGRMMIVNQNHIVNDTGNFNTGIFFGPMSCESDRPQWVIAYNVAIGANEPVVKVNDTSTNKVFSQKVTIENNFS